MIHDYYHISKKSKGLSDTDTRFLELVEFTQIYSRFTKKQQQLKKIS